MLSKLLAVIGCSFPENFEGLAGFGKFNNRLENGPLAEVLNLSSHMCKPGQYNIFQKVGNFLIFLIA